MSGAGAQEAGTPQGPAVEPASAAAQASTPPRSAFAGRTRATQLEYEAVLANASIGIAFTRDRKFFLCNPKFAEMFGWPADELIGQSGEVVYPTPESYAALGEIAVPVLSEGRQLDIEWTMRRRDGSSFACRIVAKAIDAEHPQQGTVWIAEDVTERKRQADEMARLLGEQRAILEKARALQRPRRGDVRLCTGHARGPARAPIARRRRVLRPGRSGLRGVRAGA